MTPTLKLAAHHNLARMYADAARADMRKLAANAAAAIIALEYLARLNRGDRLDSDTLSPTAGVSSPPASHQLFVSPERQDEPARQPGNARCVAPMSVGMPPQGVRTATSGLPRSCLTAGNRPATLDLPSREPCGALLAAGSSFESGSGEGLAGSDAAANKLTDIPAAPAHGRST